MMHTIAFPPGLSRFRPLSTILTYDDFDAGLNGWLDLKPNYRFEGFEPRQGPVDLTRWGPTMLSSATFAFPGTHGSMSGTYSLKLTTRPVAHRYEDIPAPGSLGHAIKRLSMHTSGLAQLEMWYTYTPEQDRIGLGEKDIRAFGVLFDVQDSQYRYMPAVRYLNAVNGSLIQRWQYGNAEGVTDAEWEYGVEGWCKRGIDPQWFGRRHADGSTDGFKFVPDGAQKLCYNESDDKINWMYLRLQIDLATRRYIELQSGERVFDLRNLAPTLVPAYANIAGLLNPMLWVETDTNRRVFLYVDSIVISVGQEA